MLIQMWRRTYTRLLATVLDAKQYIEILIYGYWAVSGNVTVVRKYKFGGIEV